MSDVMLNEYGLRKCSYWVRILTKSIEIKDRPINFSFGLYASLGTVVSMLVAVGTAYYFYDEKISKNGEKITAIEQQLAHISGQLSVLTARAEIDSLRTRFAQIAPDLPVQISPVGDSGEIQTEPGLNVIAAPGVRLAHYGWEDGEGSPLRSQLQFDGATSVTSAMCQRVSTANLNAETGMVSYSNCTPIDDLSKIEWDESWGDKEAALNAISELKASLAETSWDIGVQYHVDFNETELESIMNSMEDG